jgi:hypothetical protein
MADEKRQLILDLLARNKMSKDTKDAADDLDHLGTAAEQTGKKTEKLGKQTKGADDQVGKFGRSVTDTRGKIANLDKEIDSVQRELVSLAESFERAGSSGERLDISKGIRRTENDLRRLNKSKGILENILPDPAPEVDKWTKKLGNSIIGDLSSSSVLMTGGAVIGTILAPEIGALISAAVVGGIGFGGIIGGIALAASSDAKIKLYAGAIGKTFVSGVQAEARDAFSGPIMDNLGKVEALTQRSIGKIGKIFDMLAPSVSGLTDNLVRSGDAILDSFVNASAQAGPVLGGFGRIIEDTSGSLAGFIDMAASHSKEATSGLDDLNNALQNTIKVATQTVDALATIKGGLDSFDGQIDKTRYSLEDHVGWLDLTADGYKKGSDAAQMYRDGLIGAAGSANDYDHYLAAAVTSTDELANSQSNAAKAALGQRDALAAVSNELRAQSDPAFALLNAQDKVRESQKALTDAVKKYGGQSEQARAASRNLATSALDLQGAAGKLSSTFTGTLSPSMLATLETAGLTKSQIAAVRAEFKRAAAAGDAYAGNYVANIITNHIETFSQEHARELGRARASGGPVIRGVPYLVGENGPEILVPDTSGRVLSAAASRGVVTQGLASGAMPTGGGSRGGTMVLEVAGEQKVASFLKYMIRTYNILD